MKKGTQSKRTMISRIKALIEKHGTGGEYDKSLSFGEMEMDHTICIASLGDSTHQFAEVFGQHKVTAVTYVHDREEDEDYIAYEDLSREIVEEILEELESYGDAQDKLMESCKD
jgi:hypothetical protein